MSERYKVFTRTWWKHNDAWPKGLEPSAGKKRTLRSGLTQEEAITLCRNWNAENKPGKLSRKAEYESE